LDIEAYIKSGIIESYVLGLASAEEVIEIEKLRLQYSDIENAINEFSEMLEKEAFENAIPPPEDGKARIMAAINEDEGQSTILSTLSSANSDTTIRTPVKNLGIWRFAAAASIILFIVSAAFNFFLYNKFNKQQDAYQALLNERNFLQANNQVYQTRLQEWQDAFDVMHRPTMAMIKLPGIKGKEKNFATVFWDKKNKEVYVVANVLPKAGSGKQYQLWALVNGKPVDAGMLDPEYIGVCKMKTIFEAQAFAITLENKGGSPSPSMQEMYVMGEV
jgi:anti-sigma-K factor RskA